MKFFDRDVPKIHRCVALLYSELGEERARKILDTRAKQRAFETASGKSTVAPPPAVGVTYASGKIVIGLCRLTCLTTGNLCCSGSLFHYPSLCVS